MGKKRKKRRRRPASLWDVLVREAMKDYRAGNTRNIREFARERGIPLRDDP